MTEADSLERQMLELINAERAKVGAPALRLELNLNQAAEDHSEWMLAVDVFSHTGVGSSSPGDRMRAAGFDFSGSWSWAENIAGRTISSPAGFSDEVIALHNQLMNSTGHRNNILNPNLKYIGIGIEVGEYKGATWAMVTQNFATTGGSVDLDKGSAGAASLSTVPTDGDDRLTGTSGDDVLTGLAGRDILSGGGGNDRLNGGRGADKLDGGAGKDEADYGTAASAVRADLAKSGLNTGEAKGDSYVGIENLRGSAFDDKLAGNGGANTIRGGDGNDHISGRGGADRLYGDAGDDVLNGGGGADRLFGGDGMDTLIGKGGADVFVFATGFDADVIRDFRANGDDDRIDLSEVASITDFSDLRTNHMVQDGADVIIDAGGGDRITLIDVSLAELHGAHFIF